MAQVCLLVWDLRHETLFYAFRWRRYYSFFLTCAKNGPHLRQRSSSPAPGTILAYAKEAHFIQPKLEVHTQVRLCEVIELWISKFALERCTHLREWGLA